jgi:hypothetical protein
MWTIIVQYLDNAVDNYRTLGSKEAYRIYDSAVERGYHVLAFDTPLGYDMRDSEIGQ